MSEVYLLEHSYEIEECGHDIIKIIGVYSSQEQAEAAISRLSTQPGFREMLKCFHIDRYLVDEDNWSEGFA